MHFIIRISKLRIYSFECWNKHYKNILVDNSIYFIYAKTSHTIYLTYEQKLVNKSLFDVTVVFFTVRPIYPKLINEILSKHSYFVC